MADAAVLFDPAQVAAAERSLAEIHKRAPRVLASAVNDTARQVRSAMAKRVREKVAVQGKYANRLTKILQRAKAGNPSAAVQLKSTVRMDLKYFRPRQVAGGVEYQVLKGGERVLLPHAFGPKIDKLGRGVFLRAGKSRLPIVKQKTQRTLAQYFRDLGLVAPTETDAARRLGKNLDRRVRLELLRASGAVQ